MRKFWIVLKKELLDCFRDKRSIVMMLLPLLVYPVFLTVSNQQLTAADDTLATEITLATHNQSAIVEVVETLEASGLKVNITNGDNIVDDLKSGKAMLILDKNEDGYNILYDQNSVKSTKALGVITATIEAQKTAKIHSVLNLHGESVDFLNEYNYTMQDVTTGTGEAGGMSLFTMLGPMTIVLFVATSGTGVALDLFCGEKERGSLESLLSTQVNRRPLYFAKVITAMIFGGFGVLISVGAYLLSFILSGEIDASTSSGMGAPQMLLLFAATTAFAFFTTSVICALAISAKTHKEGSLRVSMFTIIPSLLGGASAFMETGTAPLYMSFVPIFNVIGALKSIFINVIQPEQIVITVVSTVVYGLIFLFIGQKIMDSEKILDK